MRHQPAAKSLHRGVGTDSDSGAVGNQEPDGAAPVGIPEVSTDMGVKVLRAQPVNYMCSLAKVSEKVSYFMLKNEVFWDPI